MSLDKDNVCPSLRLSCLQGSGGTLLTHTVDKLEAMLGSYGPHPQGDAYSKTVSDWRGMPTN